MPVPSHRSLFQTQGPEKFVSLCSASLSPSQNPIVSLWQMLIWNSRDVMQSLRNISGAISEWSVLRHVETAYAIHEVPIPTRVHFLQSIQALRQSAQDLGMHYTIGLIDDEFDEIRAYCEASLRHNSPRIDVLIEYGKTVLKAFQQEATGTTFLAIEPGQAEFYHPKMALFGSEVAAAFPSIAIEIAEAGRCRALELWTASVMHLMRALDSVIQTLADHVGADVGANWNQALNQIEAKLRERNKKNFDESEEQWASEAAAHLRAIKNAWRNHVQHGRSRYDAVEAKAIWDNVQALMRTLAKRLHE